MLGWDEAAVKHLFVVRDFRAPFCLVCQVRPSKSTGSVMVSAAQVSFITMRMGMVVAQARGHVCRAGFTGGQFTVRIGLLLTFGAVMLGSERAEFSVDIVQNAAVRCGDVVQRAIRRESVFVNLHHSLHSTTVEVSLLHCLEPSSRLEILVKTPRRLSKVTRAEGDLSHATATTSASVSCLPSGSRMRGA